VQFRLTSYQDMGTVYRARPRGGTHCRTIVEAKCHHDDLFSAHQSLLSPLIQRLAVDACYGSRARDATSIKYKLNVDFKRF